MAYGPAFAEKVVVTVLVAVLISETLFPNWLATYNLLPSVLIAIQLGFAVMGIVAVTVLVAVLITETEAEVPLMT